MNKTIFYESNAGTGKTFQLTRAILKTLLIDKINPKYILAVTFTEKGAAEIRQRVVKCFVTLLKNFLKVNDPPQKIPEIEDLDNEISKKVNSIFIKNLFNSLDQCFIGTIHSFCYMFLKIYGKVENIPPVLDIDQSLYYRKEIFDKVWDNVIHETNFDFEVIDGIKQLIFKIFTSTYYRAITNPYCLNEKQILDNIKSKHELLHSAQYPTQLNDAEQRILIEYLKDKLKDKKDKVNLKQLYDYWSYTPQFTQKIKDIAERVINNAMAEIKQHGKLSFDDLLIYTKDILEKYEYIRQEAKNKYRYILVDEMQDTDPVQYEIILYLSEKYDEFARSWKDVKLQEGKLFVVGDPKQSIYNFRNASLNAYIEVKDKIQKNGGQIEKLTSNTRSCKNLLDFSNKAATILFSGTPLEPQDSIYFKNIAKNKDTCKEKPEEECLVVKSFAKNKERKILDIKLEEIDYVIDSIKKEKNEYNRNYKDIAILLRKLSNAYFWVDKLTKSGIPYVVEGEKFFYRSQEVIDFLNLLFFIIEPQNPIYLAGILRSPLVAFNDFELASFFYKNRTLLSYIQRGKIHSTNDKIKIDLTFLSKDEEENVANILKNIFEIAKKSIYLSLRETIEEVLKNFPIIEVLQTVYKKDSVGPNIYKVYKFATEFEIKNISTSKYDYINIVKKYIHTEMEEGQEPLFDEGTDAVKVLTIHKSKGLEFPVVFLPLCDIKGKENYTNEVIYNWGNNLIGLKIGNKVDLPYLYLKHNLELKLDEEDEELKRILYVGFTRAEEKLYISYNPSSKILKDINIQKFLDEYSKDTITN